MKYLRRMKSSTSRTNNSSGQIGIIIIFLFLILFSIFVGRFAALESPLLVIGLVGGLIIALVTLVNTDLALIILIFSMLLSPEIPIFRVPERAVVVRIDDILLIFVFFSWLAKIAINKQSGLLKRTPLNIPIFLYILVCIFSTALAILLGIGKAKFSTAFFYILKIVEYFMLYFLVVNNLSNMKQVKRYVFFIFLVCVIICIYGYWQMQKGILRVSAPFEGKWPEPNALAAYLLIMLGLGFGFLIHSQKMALKFLSLSLIAFIFPVFLFTLSRGGYLGFLGLYLALLLFSKRKRFVLLFILITSILTAPWIFPYRVKERIITTFVPGRIMPIFGLEVPLDLSASYRVDTWSWTFERWIKSPLFGCGITGMGFLDNQYTLVWGELGIAGVFVFFWLLWRIFRNTLNLYKASKDIWVQGFCLGFLAAFFALLLHSFGANIFIIVRVMEPFWFLTAIVMMLPNLTEEKLEV